MQPSLPLSDSWRKTGPAQGELQPVVTHAEKVTLGRLPVASRAVALPLIGVFAVAAISLVPSAQHPVLLIGTWSAALAVLAGVIKHRPTERLAWYFLSGTHLLAGIAGLATMIAPGAPEVFAILVVASQGCTVALGVRFFVLHRRAERDLSSRETHLA